MSKIENKVSVWFSKFSTRYGFNDFVKSILILILISINIIQIFAQTGEKEGNGSITLNIIEQYWTYWSMEQPDPKTEVKIVKKGDKIELGQGFMGVIITIEDVKDKDGTIVVHFNGVVGSYENSKAFNWVDEIQYNKEYRISTLSKDSGIKWKLIFCK